MLGACTTNDYTVPSVQSAQKLNAIILPEFPIPGEKVMQTLQRLKQKTPDDAAVFYEYFKKLMVFEKKYLIAKENI